MSFFFFSLRVAQKLSLHRDRPWWSPGLLWWRLHLAACCHLAWSNGAFPRLSTCQQQPVESCLLLGKWVDGCPNWLYTCPLSLSTPVTTTLFPFITGLLSLVIPVNCEIVNLISPQMSICRSPIWECLPTLPPFPYWHRRQDDTCMHTPEVLHNPCGYAVMVS